MQIMSQMEKDRCHQEALSMFDLEHQEEHVLDWLDHRDLLEEAEAHAEAKRWADNYIR